MHLKVWANPAVVGGGLLRLRRGGPLLLTPLLIWLAVLDLLGWFHFPLCFRVGRLLRDRGLALAKLAGLLVPTYVSWLICHTAVPHSRVTIVAVVVVLVVVNAIFAVRDHRAYRSFFARRWRVVLVLEAVFWIGGVGAGWVRSHIPAIAFDPNWWGAEKWSDFALLSALSRQVHFPPFDPWLAGFPINYYYFGHLAWATLGKLTAIPPNVAYNLALATIVALALVLCVSLGYHLFRSLGLGVLLAWLVVCGGNLKPLAQLYQNSLDAGQFVHWIDFWDTSRAMSWGAGGLIRGPEINEFPSFSFILGDLHPHFSAHPLFLGFLLLVAALWRAGGRETLSAHHVVIRRLWQWIPLVFLAGLLYTTNSWDCFVGLFLAAVALPCARGFRRWSASGRLVFGLFILALCYVVATRLMFLPFDRFFIPPRSFHLSVYEWLPPRMKFHSPLAWVPPELRSTTTQWLFYFGLFAVPYFIWQAWGTTARLSSVALDKTTACLAVALAAGVVFSVQGQNRLVGLLAFVLVVLAPSAFRQRRRERLRLVSILAWLALFVSFLCEWFYYDDAFSGTNERINTVFKVYYCLWPVMALGVVGACSALWGGPKAPCRRVRRVAASLLMLSLIVVSALYPLFGWTTRVATYATLEIGTDAPPTLDGLKYLESLPGLSDDYDAAQWLFDNASPYAIVAEAHHWGYSAAGRFAAIGGVRSLLGWSQHESVWREGLGWPLVASRKATIDDLFTTTSLPATLAILQANRVDFVAVGSLERQQYPAQGLAKFDLLGKVLFRSGETVIYGISPTAKEAAGAVGDSP